MSSTFKKTIVLPRPRVGEKITRDTLYWKNWEFPVTRKEHGGIRSLHFSPSEPYSLAATSGIKVQVLSSENNDLLKSFTRFKENAACGCFRSDGKLIVAGGDEGLLRLFDVAGKQLLRVFKGHTRPVKAACFSTDNLHVLSGSDDHTVRRWDIAAEEETASFKEHTDYIRSVASSPASSNLTITGSYDHTVRVYDWQAGSVVLSMDHGAPVEAVLALPGGGLLASAGGQTVKLWDVLAGGRLLTTLHHHHKTVTCLALASNKQRLLTAGLDRLVKVYDIASYSVVASLDYPSAILSMAISPDDSMLAVGMDDGLLSMQRRKPEKTGNTSSKHQKVSNAKKGAYQYRLKARLYSARPDDAVITHTSRPYLPKYDKMLKRFDYSKALDAALDARVRTQKPEETIAVLQELIRRSGLRGALAGRDIKSLTGLLKFLQRNLSNPNYMACLVDVTSILLDVYSEQVGHWPDLEELLLRLKYTLDQEVSYQRELFELMGGMDTLFAAASQEDIPAQHLQTPLSIPSDAHTDS